MKDEAGETRRSCDSESFDRRKILEQLDDSRILQPCWHLRLLGRALFEEEVEGTIETRLETAENNRKRFDEFESRRADVVREGDELLVALQLDFLKVSFPPEIGE